MELIERDDFLALLRNRFKKIASEEGHCFFIMGEAGIGKTSLVKTFLKEVENDSVEYVGACDSLFTPRPLAPLYDLALQIKEDWVNNIHSISSRTELFTKFVQELTYKVKPVVLVFEDIHWADEATLDFVKFFARRISRTKCMFILTYRDDEINQQHPLRNVLGDLSPDTFTRIGLTPLSRQAVSKMADEKGYDAEEVYNISGGNPFYVTEILASYSPGVPDNIKDAILAVYNRLEEETRNKWQLLSVIPEGLELSRFAAIDASWHEAIEQCLVKKILVIRNNKVFFKHELYRRTIESSLSPFKRIALNKNLLELFLPAFETKQEIERIVHYAKNANENDLVVKYAPLAAEQAVSVGAHREASKLFLTAIEYYQGHDQDQLVQFYEAYTYECYLTNQIRDAIIYQGKALKIWKAKNNIDQIANSLRFLSRLWWFDGNRADAEKYAKEAIGIVQDQPSSKAKAMAFSNMSQLKMLSEETAACIEWGTSAIEIAKEINDEETLCHALNNVGSAQWTNQPFEETGKKNMLESLAIALKNSFHEHAARAYTNIIHNCVISKDYDQANEYLKEGLAYCEERDLISWTKYNLSLKARALMETGDWKQAASVAKNLIANPRQPAIIKIGALHVLATIKVRCGEPDALAHLQEAKSLAFEAREHQRIIPVMIAFLEYEWLVSKEIITTEELKTCIDLVQNVENTFLNNEFDYWLQKVRKRTTGLTELQEPYKLLKEGKFMLAANFWDKTGCQFEKAFALYEGDDDGKRNALTILQQLGATAVYEKMKMEMRAVGIKKIPRGIRESTRSNPAQLTNRELDVLQLLKEGVQNKEIADTLFISPKTVDHHISSILFKLDVNSRSKAVSEALRLSILK
jgi:DNA-binding CsgD family transcriptional regulator